ncbi:MmgE/PrpD family protein [Ruegeria sp. 2205SS24-7]|uniref:MmgE/PrpD family protein n=1 Tax=Ruegeria discodermiae TaxID=3064389 RepID=UPI0027416D78|nr:MmgE/PrpD family protein [Ruegeria sp. 2205SS24-7]MDP5217750.1 MmgE/PrpD family protein [Ruegeria sp. 2205SS24-7]
MTERFNRIADFALHLKPSDIPDSALHAAALMMLDTLGIVAASTPMEAGVIARDTADLLYASNDPGHAARMLFDGRKVSMAGAAYAAATQTDNLDAHDGFNPVKGHIGVAVIPALAALAQHLPDLSGRDALAAITIGYEIAGRAGLALHASVSDYHTSGAWNALGVAAVAARLRGHSADQLRQALGIAEYHGPRSQMMREIANPTMLHDGSGWGAMVGISAAILAERGFTGAPAITVEDANIEPHWNDLGQVWQMEQQYIKPYPICRWAHAAIDAVARIMQDHGLTHEQITRARINSFHEAACLFPGMPETTSQAQYSLRFAVASQMVHGQIGVAQISGAGLTDPVVAALIQRIEVAETEGHNARFPACRTADAEVETSDGQVLRSSDTHARGGVEVPMSEEEIIGKYMSFAAPCLGETRAIAVSDRVLGLTQAESRVSDLLPLLCEPL